MSTDSQLDERKPRNRARCRNCGDVVESTHRHHFVTCKCGGISVDGGNNYFRRCAKDISWVEELPYDDD